MRLLVVAESPPTTDPVGGNGSTMIVAQLLRRLPDTVRVDLLYFADRPQPPDPEVSARAASVTALPVRSPASALLAQPFTRLPRATWQRAGAAERILSAALDSDVVYLHGLHTFSVLTMLPTPVVVNEVDPWSDYWSERARERRGPGAWYDRLQAARARRLEAVAAEVAAAVVVVSHADADRLRSRTGGHVVAIPNGTARAARSPASGEPSTIAFVGTLDYPPNVEAVSRLVRDVLPLVRRHVPDVRVLLAGRRPTPAVEALQGSGVELLGDVADVADVFARAQVAVYPGRTGRGTKNTVAEAIAAGCPVVASVESARGHAPGEHLRIGVGDEELAELVTSLLSDPSALERARRACSVAAADLVDWDQAADRYFELFRTAGRVQH